MTLSDEDGLSINFRVSAGPATEQPQALPLLGDRHAGAAPVIPSRSHWLVPRDMTAPSTCRTTGSSVASTS